ncbi:hypothetical protein D3C71_2241760 [compost metagenome]
MQAGKTAQLLQHMGAKLEAVVDLRGGAHVEQGALHMGIRIAHTNDVQAADQVRLVFLVGQPARG